MIRKKVFTTASREREDFDARLTDLRYRLDRGEDISSCLAITFDGG